jgi:hypothetical protein
MFIRVQSDLGPSWATNISLGGMRLKAPHFAGVGRYIELRFTLPGQSEPMQIGGQVTGLDQDEQGQSYLNVEFRRLSSRDQLEIYQFIDARRQLWDRKLQNIRRDTLDYPIPKRPFSALLLQASAQLSRKMTQPLAFIRQRR